MSFLKQMEPFKIFMPLIRLPFFHIHSDVFCPSSFSSITVSKIQIQYHIFGKTDLDFSEWEQVASFSMVLNNFIHINTSIIIWLVLRWWLIGKESACQCRRHGFNPWVETIPWRRQWQPTPVFLPGKSHGQRSLDGYSPWVCKRVRHDLLTKQQ